MRVPSIISFSPKFLLHPIVEKFQHIKDAYEILSDDVLRDAYEKFLKGKSQQQARKFEDNAERAKFASDLLRKEELYNKQKEEEAQEKLRNFFAKREEVGSPPLFQEFIFIAVA